MQKLPEAPDRKKGDVYAKKEPSRQKKESLSLLAVTSEATTLKSFLLLEKGPTCLCLYGTLVNISISSNRFFYQQLTAKKYQIMDPLKTITKIPYNGLSKLQLKYRIIDIINRENDYQISTNDLGKMTVLK